MTVGISSCRQYATLRESYNLAENDYMWNSLTNSKTISWVEKVKLWQRLLIPKTKLQWLQMYFFLSLSLFLFSCLSLLTCLSLYLFSSWSLLRCLFLFLFVLISLLTSISLHFFYTSSHFYLFLCFLPSLSLFSFTTPLFVSLALSSLSLQSSLFSTLWQCSLVQSALSLCTQSLTSPESQRARALAHSLNGELLASRRKNLYRCSVVCWLWMLLLWCGVLCVVVCVVCVVRGYPSKRFRVTPCRFVRACFEFLAT